MILIEFEIRGHIQLNLFSYPKSFENPLVTCNSFVRSFQSFHEIFTEILLFDWTKNAPPHPPLLFGIGLVDPLASRRYWFPGGSQLDEEKKSFFY